jgi:two-component system sensor histidine kinase PilS (NtrC family)
VRAAQRRRHERLAGVGQLAADLAHEIRNPLAAITGAVEALGHGGLPQQTCQTLSTIVLRESDRLNRIIEEFLAYARPTPLTLRRADVADLLQDVLAQLEQRPLPEGVKVVRAFDGPLWAEVDPTAIRQALWNLCVYAADAMPESGELTIAASRTDETLEIRVSDTGPGIAASDLAHLFEPFFSVKPDRSGLGLALVHRMVRDHGGHVEARSELGFGTTFTVTLPVTHA